MGLFILSWLLKVVCSHPNSSSFSRNMSRRFNWKNEYFSIQLDKFKASCKSHTKRKLGRGIKLITIFTSYFFRSKIYKNKLDKNVVFCQKRQISCGNYWLLIVLCCSKCSTSPAVSQLSNLFINCEMKNIRFLVKTSCLF